MIDLLGYPPDTWLPFVFAGLMALSVFAYVVLDGFDLGIGIIMAGSDRAERDRMINTIGPYWDVNEVWLVLGVGLLLVGFPKAHGIILTSLYLPCAIMLTGLILRGVSFKFRVKALDRFQGAWDWAFVTGSLVTTLAQGYMLGRYLLGFANYPIAYAFACLSAIGATIAYVFIGACWLIFKTEGELREKALRIAQISLVAVALSLLAVSFVTPYVSHRIFERWFSSSTLVLLAPVPVLTGGLLIWLYATMREPWSESPRDVLPFIGAVGLFALGFIGIGYSFYPYIVPESLTIYEAASAPESLWIIFLGVCIILPIMTGSAIFTYRVFGGKSENLHY